MGALALGAEHGRAVTAVMAVAQAKSEGAKNFVALLPHWARDYVGLSAIVECCPSKVLYSALTYFETFSVAMKHYVSIITGLLKVPASIHSATAMRFCVLFFLGDENRGEGEADPFTPLIRSLQQDATLQGAGWVLMRHLLLISDGATDDFKDLGILYLNALVRLRLSDAERPRARKLPYGTFGDYWGVEKSPEEEYAVGQIRPIMTSLLLSDTWSPDALSLFTSTIPSRPIPRTALTDHRPDAKFICATQGVKEVTGWLPTAVYRCVHWYSAAQ